jgi:hypothetical protein
MCPDTISRLKWLVADLTLNNHNLGEVVRE